MNSALPKTLNLKVNTRDVNEVAVILENSVNRGDAEILYLLHTV